MHVLILLDKNVTTVRLYLHDLCLCGCLCRVLHNYLMWHLVKVMSTYLSKPFQEVKKEFLKILSGWWCFCF